MPITLHLAARSLTLMLILSIMAGCNSDDPPQQTGATGISILTSTPIPLPKPSSTPLKPSSTAIKPLPTPTNTSTSTSTVTASATSEPVSLIVNQDVPCWNGPAQVYGIRAYLTLGAEPSVVGHTEDDSWWSVEIPEFGAICWLSGEYLTITGDTDTAPVLTPGPTPTLEITATPKLGGLKYYLIAEDTGGPFGCGDGLVYFRSGKPKSGNVESDIRSALNALFKVKSKYVGDYYNPVYHAHLHVKNVTVDKSTGFAEVYLAGSIPKPADKCESKRIHDVVWTTAEQFPEVNRARIWVGDKKLGDLIAVGDK